MAPHNRHAGIYCYFTRPDSKSLRAVFGGKSDSVEIERVARDLNRTVLGPLMRVPRPTARRRPIDPRARAAPRAPAVAAPPTARAPMPSAPLVRRAPAAGKKVKDTFDFAKWNTARVGLPTSAASSFKSRFEKAIPGQDQDAIIAKGAAADSTGLMESETGASGLEKPANASKLIEHEKSLRKFRFWAGPAGGVIGRVRSLFGGLYARVIDTVGRRKAKVAEKFKTFKF